MRLFQVHQVERVQQLCQEGFSKGGGKSRRVSEEDGKGVALAPAVLGLNTFVQTTALIMTEPLDLVQNWRSGKKKRKNWDDRHFSTVHPDWNRQGKATTLFLSSLSIF